MTKNKSNKERKRKKNNQRSKVIPQTTKNARGDKFAKKGRKNQKQENEQIAFVQQVKFLQLRMYPQFLHNVETKVSAIMVMM